MAGTFTIKLLADGQLGTTEADLYLVPAATTAIIKTIKLVNTNTTTEVINLYIKKAAGTSRLIMPQNLNLSAGYMAVEDDELTLGVGDAVRGYATTANKVDFTVYGVEET